MTNYAQNIFFFMFFEISNFQILFLALKSFFMNSHFSSAQVPRDEKYKFAKTDSSTKNKILKFKIAKNIKTKNVLRIIFTNFGFPTYYCDFIMSVSNAIETLARLQLRTDLWLPNNFQSRRSVGIGWY